MEPTTCFARCWLSFSCCQLREPKGGLFTRTKPVFTAASNRSEWWMDHGRWTMVCDWVKSWLKFYFTIVVLATLFPLSRRDPSGISASELPDPSLTFVTSFPSTAQLYSSTALQLHSSTAYSSSAPKLFLLLHQFDTREDLSTVTTKDSITFTRILWKYHHQNLDWEHRFLSPRTSQHFSPESSCGAVKSTTKDAHTRYSLKY